MTKQTKNNAAAIAAILANADAETLNTIAAALAAANDAKPAAAEKPAAKSPAKKAATAKKATAKTKKAVAKDEFVAGNWVSYLDDNGAPRFCKAIYDADGLMVKAANGQLMHVSHAKNIRRHETQGQALQAYNALKAAAKHDAKPAAAKRPQWLKGSHADKNAEILTSVKSEVKGEVVRMLKRLINNGYPNAFLAMNKNHQKDALSLYCGEKGKGAAIQRLENGDMKNYRMARERAAANGEQKPVYSGAWFYSPARGGKFYMFGAFDA